jgi:hypothetical protein
VARGVVKEKEVKKWKKVSGRERNGRVRMSNGQLRSSERVVEDAD